ncbi:MAG: MBL fold metallo-hydrolase, partial [Oscillospiraceae bacterium]
MKNRIAGLFFVLGLIAVLLLGACAADSPNTSGTVPQTSSEVSNDVVSAPPAAAPAASSELPERADFSDRVFDVSQDAGKLTVRFLNLTLDHHHANGMTTTGDSAVYASPDGQIMLIDCGNYSAGEEVVQQLKQLGVSKIDIFVASHPHADHIGGFPRIAEQFEIGQIYVNGHLYSTGTFDSMMTIIQEKKIPMTSLKEGDQFDFGKDVDVHVYNPPEGYTFETQLGGHNDANNGSLCLKLLYGDSSFLRGGDLYLDAEKRLSEQYPEEIHADVMKLNHHGWDTSNGKQYIAAVSPKIVVGMHDSIPSMTVALRCRAAGAQTFYNCIDGAVRI